ncbi:MAG: BTAD domain-containing putative transcriptional regulator [Acidobacteriota bacterium]
MPTELRLPAGKLLERIRQEPPGRPVALWTWSSLEAELWLAALAESEPPAVPVTREDVSGLRSGEIGLLAASPPSSSGVREPGTPGAPQALPALPNGARLVLAASPRPTWSGFAPAAVLKPRDPALTLDLEQLESCSESLGASLPAEELRRILDLAAGWPLASLLLLRARAELGSLEKALRSEELRGGLERAVLSPLPAEERRALLAWRSQPASLSAWRHFLAGEGDAAGLAALVHLEQRWGLVGENAPPDLRPIGAADAGRPTARRLAASAYALGDAAEAVRLLERAGDSEAAAALSTGLPRGPATGRRGLAGAGRPRRFRVRLFGAPTVSLLDGEGEREIRWRLHRSLLAISRLALAPDQRVSREDLIETLWPQASAEHVKRNLHPTLSGARKALGGGRGGGIVYRQGSYLLDPEVEWRIDVREFEDGVAGARDAESGGRDEEALRLLKGAWRLYRGPLLDGQDGSWIEPRREWLHRRYLTLLERLGGLATRSGHETLALDAFRSLLLEEPFEERIHLSVMEIYGARGRRDLVRRQFVRLQELLKDLHVEPTETVIDRYHQLMG